MQTLYPHRHPALGIAVGRLDSARNLQRAIQKRPPDYFIGGFAYGWGNDYAGATVPNRDCACACALASRRA